MTRLKRLTFGDAAGLIGDHTVWSFAVRSIQLFGTQFDPFPFNAFPGFGVVGFSLASNFGLSYA